MAKGHFLSSKTKGPFSSSPGGFLLSCFFAHSALLCPFIFSNISFRLLKHKDVLPKKEEHRGRSSKLLEGGDQVGKAKKKKKNAHGETKY